MRYTYKCAKLDCKALLWVGCSDRLCPNHCQEKENEKREKNKQQHVLPKYIIGEGPIPDIPRCQKCGMIVQDININKFCIINK